jgi:hypothetical protein
MRRFTTAITAAALTLSMALSLNLGTAQAATPGYDSAYQFESAFLTVKAGDSGTFSVFFANTGTTSWSAGSGTQVNLGVCAADKVTCNVPSANAAWAQGWLSTTAYATHTKTVVVPGDFSAFTYNVKVPAGASAGTYRFNGDLVLATTGDRIHPEGYYQDASISTQAVGAAISASPAFSTDSANEASAAVPGTGQHTITFTVTGLSGTLDAAITASSNVTQNADGSYSFCDINQDSKGDGVGGGSTFFTAVNGRSITASPIIINEPIPASGTFTVTIDSATRNQRVRVVLWQDLSDNGQIDLTGAGDVNCDAFTPYNSTLDGAMGVSGRKFYTGPEGTFGTQNFDDPTTVAVETCGPVYRHSGSLQMFTAGAAFIPPATSSSSTSNRYDYDSNDIFRVASVQVTLAQFKSALTASSSGTGDTVSINYNPDPAGISEFNICFNAGAAAPNDVSAATGSFDSGSTANDVRLTFTAPSTNAVTSYTVQRAGVTAPASAANCNLGATAPSTSDSAGLPGGTLFTTVGAVSVDAGKTGTFTNFDLIDGGYCFRIKTQDPTTGTPSFSNYVPVNIPGAADTSRPVSSSAVLTTSAGLSNTVDSGDKFEITFSEAMSVAANAVIRITDSDCGNATNTGPFPCPGGTTNTVADILCGTNATCSLDTAKTKLTVTMTANPTVIASGSTTGSQYPVVVTDNSGINDLSGNQWDIGCGAQSPTGTPACAVGSPAPDRLIP